MTVINLLLMLLLLFAPAQAEDGRALPVQPDGCVDICFYFPMVYSEY